MSTEVTDEEIEKVLLEVLRKICESNPLGPQTINELCEEYKYSRKHLTISEDDEQRRVLSVIYGLFRNGHLAWGYNFEKPTAPHCHITDRGKEMLKRA